MSIYGVHILILWCLCLFKRHTFLASNESLCCVHSTTCSAVTHLTTFHRRGCPICRQSVAAFGWGSDSTQNESLVRVGLPFDGHQTVQLPQEVGRYKNTPLKSSSINRHRGHCTVHMCMCEWECRRVCECVLNPFSLTLLSVLFRRLRYFETKNEYFIGWLWGQ